MRGARKWLQYVYLFICMLVPLAALQLLHVMCVSAMCIRFLPLFSSYYNNIFSFRCSKLPLSTLNTVSNIREWFDGAFSKG